MTASRFTLRMTAPVAVLLSFPIAAQSSVRCWGGGFFDTAAYDLPALSVSAAGYAGAVVRADGRLFVHGQLYGVPLTGNLRHPPSPPPGLTFTEVSIGTHYGLGLLSDGTLLSWGGGQTIGPPPALPAGVTYTRASAGHSHALAMRSDGVLVAWGDNTYGNTTLPVLPSGVSVVKFHAGASSHLLLSDGTIRSFGSCQYGDCNVPPLPAGVTYVDMWCGMVRNFALRSDSVLVGWGDNTWGPLNIVPPPPGTHYLMAAGANLFGIAVRSDGVLVSWGNQPVTPPTLPPGTQVVDLVGGGNHVLILLSDGTVLGCGDPRFFAFPTPTLPASEQWVDFGAGAGHCIGRTSQGAVVAWGSPSFGMTSVPALPSGVSYGQLDATIRGSGALRSDGLLEIWGYNQFGQANVPALPAGTVYTDFSLGSNHTVALRSDGVAVGFGGNTFGETSIPALPPGVSYEEVDCEGRATILLRSDGNIEQLGGPGPFTSVPTPPAGIDYVQVAAGFEFAALRSDGEVVTWGSAVTNRLPPPPPGVVYVEVAGGEAVLVARRSDGRLEYSSPLYQAETPRLLPGESYVQVSATFTSLMGRVGPTSTYVTYAPGCPGTRAATRLIPRDTPRLGDVLRVRLFDLPQDAAIMAFGFQRTAAPVSLAGIGLPGCSAHMLPLASFLVLGSNNQAVAELGIPSDLNLIGVRFQHQAVVLDSAANAAGFVVSDAAEGVVGGW